MILCMDVGNSQLFGGLYSKDKLLFRFRHATRNDCSSDEWGIFLRNVLRENNFDYRKIERIAISSVVPKIDYSLRSACQKYFNISPFMLQAGVKTGLKIKYRNPLEVGSDRIANAMAALHRYPNQPVIVVDFGTATTCDAVSASKEYWGGAIMAGMRLSIEALQNNTAKLSSVEIVKPENSVSRSTRESLQIGLYYGQLGAIKEVIRQTKESLFNNQSPVVIGTGGFSHLFTQENVFDKIIPDLVLEGIYLALMMNTST
ncbi:MAG: type III pantothenate kinase [Coxiellaceae bacterium]|nr:MAG: type III pantothenate kinase [Coxiellaceae bacterium]